MYHRALSSPRAARVVAVAAFALAATVATAAPARARPGSTMASGSPIAATRSGSTLTDVFAGPVVTAAQALAHDAHLPLSEAVRQVRRQDGLAVLADQLRQRLGGWFGGAWIDHGHGGRLTVGVTDRRAEAVVRQVATRAGAPDTVTTRVRHSAATLERIADQIGARVAATNRGATSQLAAWIAPERNVVELRVPASRATLTPAQRRLVAQVGQQYADVVTLTSDTALYAASACDSQSACDPPLRSGVAIVTDAGRCTSAFPVAADTRYYLLTAGHCTRVGETWMAGTDSFGMVPIGSRAGSIFGERGDIGLISVDDPTFWRPAGLVYPERPVTATGTAVAGMVVCKTGSTTGTTCGTVTRTDVTVPYQEGTVRGLTYATACVSPGDSGGGVWSGTTAYGIVSGGLRIGCGMVFEPVQAAVKAFGVQVLLSHPAITGR